MKCESTLTCGLLSLQCSGAMQGPFKVEEDQGHGPSLQSRPGIKMVPNGISGALPVKKKRNRFNGMTEEEVLKRKLPDRLAHGLDILIVSDHSLVSLF